MPTFEDNNPLFEKEPVSDLPIGSQVIASSKKVFIQSHKQEQQVLRVE